MALSFPGSRTPARNRIGAEIVPRGSLHEFGSAWALILTQWRLFLRLWVVFLRESGTKSFSFQLRDSKGASGPWSAKFCASFGRTGDRFPSSVFARATHYVQRQGQVTRVHTINEFMVHTGHATGSLNRPSTRSPSKQSAESHHAGSELTRVLWTLFKTNSINLGQRLEAASPGFPTLRGRGTSRHTRAGTASAAIPGGAARGARAPACSCFCPRIGESFLP